MKQIVLVLAMIVAWAFPMEAEDSPQGLRTVISEQVDAFLESDLARAFSYASPGIQRIFVTPEGFGEMVKTGYPMVWRPSEMRFLELREVDGVPWQKVLMRDADGVWHVLDYKMTHETGVWRIDAVQYLRQSEIGV